ncbi:MAG: hypothetical protein RLY31_82 [Bacteroidota bacterium]|jgi:hypothetical protein
MPASNNLLNKAKDPVIQSGVVLAAILLVNVLAAFARSAGMDVEDRFPWTVAASFLLFFAAGNAVLSLQSADMDRYWTRSVLCFASVAVLSAFLAYLFSALPMRQAGSYRWIYIVLTIGYLVFLSMVTFMRKIVDFAQREEWNHPKVRKRRK